MVGAHRLAYELNIGPIPDGLMVLHRCDNPACCNPAHLFLGTAADNIHDMDAKGRRPSIDFQGEANPRSKLTDDDVRVIRTTWAAGIDTQAALARRFGVSAAVISSIIRNKRWTHVV